MPYPEIIVREVRAVSPRCFCCNRLFEPNEYRAVHSGTGRHLILAKAFRPERYIYLITDSPKKYERTHSNIVEVNRFPVFGFRYFADAVCLCDHCHRKIHAFALELCRGSYKGFTGNTPTPDFLALATFNYNVHNPPV
jgi:hypothetical protein